MPTDRETFEDNYVRSTKIEPTPLVHSTRRFSNAIAAMYENKARELEAQRPKVKRNK